MLLTLLIMSSVLSISSGLTMFMLWLKIRDMDKTLVAQSNALLSFMQLVNVIDLGLSETNKSLMTEVGFSNWKH